MLVRVGRPLWILALLGLLAGCGSGSDDRAASARSNDGPDRAASPAEASEPTSQVSIGDTPVSVPSSPPPGFTTPQTQTQTLDAGDGTTVTLATYEKEGPIAGTTVGHLTVAVVDDATKAEALRSGDQAELAELMPRLGTPELVTDGNRRLVWWPERDAMSGEADIGQPERTSRTVEFSVDGRYAVQVNADGLDDAALREFIARIEA